MRRLYSGHRISSRLPWYRGDAFDMKAEAQALCSVVERHLFFDPRRRRMGGGAIAGLGGSNHIHRSPGKNHEQRSLITEDLFVTNFSSNRREIDILLG